MEDIRELQTDIKSSKTVPPDVIIAGYRYLQRKTIVGCLQDYYTQQKGSLSDLEHKIPKLYRFAAYHGYNIE